MNRWLKDVGGKALWTSGKYIAGPHGSEPTPSSTPRISPGGAPAPSQLAGDSAGAGYGPRRSARHPQLPGDITGSGGDHHACIKGFIRYHLGLKVPEPRAACRIRVGGGVAHWEEGKSLFFDDTYPHEVWNDTDGVRVALFMNVIRPLRFPASAVNRGVLSLIKWSPYVREARRNAAEWEKRFAR